jgi:glycosyltransferase involved in cell wall biosynthesis
MSVQVSVITVVYNRVAEIEATIQSVARQTYSNIEYIVVDGGSTDGTTAVIEKNRQHITKWISEPDKGIYDAMNKGLHLATGEWLYFLNSGDVFLNDGVVNQIAPQLAQSKFSVMAGKVETVGEKATRLLPAEKNLTDNSARHLFSSSFCHQALFVRRTAYLSQGGYDLSYRTFADFDVVHKIIRQEQGFQKVSLVIARYDMSGVSNNWRLAVRHFIESERLFAAHGEVSPGWLYRLRRLKASLFFFRKMVLYKLGR